MKCRIPETKRIQRRSQKSDIRHTDQHTGTAAGGMAAHGVVMYSLGIAPDAGLIVAGAVSLSRDLTKVHSKHSDEAKPPRAVHPVFLFFFGDSNTIGNLPTAFFIARVVDAQVSVFAVVLLLALYCCVYTMPLMILHFSVSME